MGKKKNQIREPWVCPTCDAKVPYFWQVCPNDQTYRPRKEVSK